MWKTKVEAWIITSTSALSSTLRVTHGLSLMKLLSSEQGYHDIMELSSTAESAMTRLQAVYGLTPEEKKQILFHKIGNFGACDGESVNGATIRLRVLIKRSES